MTSLNNANPKLQSISDWLDDFGDVSDTETIKANSRIGVSKFVVAGGTTKPSKDVDSYKNRQVVREVTPKSNIDWRSSMDAFSTTEELMKEISEAQFCWMNLLVQGHMTVICSKGNGGKTTIMIKACEDMAKAGYDIWYVNADASADQLKNYHAHATKHGYKLLAPDLHAGKSANDIVTILRDMSLTGENFSGTVLVLDTLKKFASLMNKTMIKEFNGMLRSLTAKGMTIICLAHTNKHDDKDGKPIFEGTGDVRNDFDELIYLIPAHNNDGTSVVSTCIDKIRASSMKNYTFDISRDREVAVRDEFQDLIGLHQMQVKMEIDREIIDSVFESIKLKSKSIEEIYVELKGQGIPIGRDALRKAITSYSSDFCQSPLWLSIPTGRNGFRYGLIANECKTPTGGNRYPSKSEVQ